MKLIIAGGRDYLLSYDEYLKLHNIPDVTEVVSGGARGVDNCGEFWARNNGIPVKVFPADWKKYGKAAGPRRNKQMAEYADALAVFPGGSGTANMISQALEHGLVIYDFGAEVGLRLMPVLDPKPLRSPTTLFMDEEDNYKCHLCEEEFDTRENPPKLIFLNRVCPWCFKNHERMGL